MLQFFRNFFSSTLGIALTLGMVGLIALAFAAGDIASSGGMGGLVGGDRAATVGNQRISTAQLAKELTRGLEQARQQDPRLSMKDFLAGGGMELALGQLIDRVGMAAFGNKHGIVAGKRLVDSELAKIPGLQGLNGKFSDAIYHQMLTQRTLSDAEVRSSITQSLIARQALRPADYGAELPGGVVLRYAQILKEHRSGIIAALPATAFAPHTPPSDAEIATYYAGHHAAFMRPELRVLRYAVFGDNSVKSVARPTDAEIAAVYNADKAQYAASESRHVTQLIAPTQAAAQAIASEIAAGKPLEAAATSKGLSAASPGLLTQAALADQSSAEVAAAAFAGHKGALIGPVQDSLGWHLLRIDQTVSKAAHSLDQARGEIATKLTADKRKAALADITGKIDDKLGQGYALTDAAKDLGLTLQETAKLTADGHVFGKPTATVPKELAGVIKAAFDMPREHQPQLAEVETGKTYVIFDVAGITAAAAAPLADIKPQVAAALAAEQGAAAARIAAQRVLAQVRSGQDLTAALHSLSVALPPATSINMGRDQLSALGAKAPPPLKLLFAMAPGTVKLMPGAAGQVWYLVQLKAIQPADIAPNDPLLATAASELNRLAGSEFAEELEHAIRAEGGVTRNPAAIKAVAAQAIGGN
jgi:peptidyl-prolyl cis-trans isomerase D